jgi:(4-(4-[2-(gamma-L-glutamylamino)ethyl]phenoxymethyl)furan-2-yl)methanamine synthase
MINMSQGTPGLIGWDIGGANLKAVRLDRRIGHDPELRQRSIPLEIQRDPGALAPALRAVADSLDAAGLPHAVTMTAELSQAFRTKREGVGAVLDAVEQAFPRAEVAVYTVAGRFVSVAEARAVPLEVAASNWAATARLVARFAPDCVLMDIGTTTTDIIPIVGGELAARGRTDPERLSSGELVYTGALRTPCEAVSATVPFGDGQCGVAAEGFALMGDVHVWTGALRPDDYTVAAPDGRPATREFAGERLARVVCGDREMLDAGAIDRIAAAFAEAQVERVAAALLRIRKRHPTLETAVVTGVGDFIAARAARRADLAVVSLADRIGAAGRTAPAAAVAWLLAEWTAEPAR